MVSWDLVVELDYLSPHIKELQKIAKQERFSNIESLEYLGTFKGKARYRLSVNNRGLNQKKFKIKKIK